MEQKRLFVAIKIHPGEEFLRLYYQLKKTFQQEKIKWVEQENVHLTLKFLGETPTTQVEDIVNALAEARLGIMPFDLVMEGMGIFGSSYQPRVIWFGIKEDKQMSNLVENIFNELELVGFERDRQNFVPHLTVGRIKEIGDKKHFQEKLDNIKPGHIQTDRVEEFYLFESILQPEGPVYEIIETISL
jgi:2'-5' RNA ligase